MNFQNSSVDVPNAAQSDSDIFEQCLSTLRENLCSTDITLAAHAAEGLTEAGYASEVTLALAPRMAGVSIGRDRCLIARELVRAGRHQELVILADSLEHGNEVTQIAAAESLFKIRRSADETLAHRLLAQSGSMALQLMILAMLACSDNKDALNRIRLLLSDESFDARRIAAWILARLGSPCDIQRLRKIHIGEVDVVLRAYVDHALAALGDKAGLRSLKVNLRSTNREVRRAAAETLLLVSHSLRATESPLLLADQDSDVQIRAAHALLCCNSPHARDRA